MVVMRKYLAAFLTLIFVLSVAVYSYADLKTLMKLGSEQGKIAKALQKETKNYKDTVHG